jgi:diadenosine tetraphosphate (Ap4A) HIT family hydrolase
MALNLSPITIDEYERLAYGDPAYGHLKIKDFRSWRLYLNEDQTYLGRCYLWLHGQHTDLQQRPELPAYHQRELKLFSGMVFRALSRLWSPDMVNEFYAGNEYEKHRGHAHLHLIPRYYLPAEFAGQLFPDERFGKNYAPYEKKRFSASLLKDIRDALADELSREVAT